MTDTKTTKTTKTTHPNLPTALAAFQAEMPTVNKGKTARVPTKTGGQYTYSYADIADVTQAVMPLLSKHGLSFMCTPRSTDNGYEMVGFLLHESGDKSEEGALPLFGRTSQEIGSSITYMRRYLIGSITGVVTDDDEDGAASNVTQDRPQRQSVNRAAAREPLTPEQIDAIGQWGQIVSLPDVFQVILNRADASSTTMTRQDGDKVLDYLNATGEQAAQVAHPKPPEN